MIGVFSTKLRSISSGQRDESKPVLTLPCLLVNEINCCSAKKAQSCSVGCALFVFNCECLQKVFSELFCSILCVLVDCGVGDRVWSVEVACGEVVCLGYAASFHHHLVSLAVWNLRLVFLVLVAEVNTLSATLFRQRKPVGVIWSDLQHFCSYSNEFRHFCSSCLRRKWNAYSLCVVFCIVYSFWMYTVYVWKYLITQTASRVFVVRFTCTSDVMAGYFTLRDCTEKSWRTT